MRRKEIERKISGFEESLKVQFPRSYRQFLLEQATEREKEEEQGILLSFQPGDPGRGGFQWIGYYENKVVGLCSLSNCRICNMREREKLEDFEGGELRVGLELRQSREKTREFYLAHLVSVPEEKVRLPVLGLSSKEEPMSVLEATRILRNNRPDLKDKPVVAICFNKGRAMLPTIKGLFFILLTESLEWLKLKIEALKTE
jgi:hypothetical protein